jgi:outer membrane receptor protein involved in Fe transport
MRYFSRNSRVAWIGETAGRERLAGDLARLRQDLVAWLATYPPAQQSGQRWLESQGTGADVEELAAEVGRLRAAILRIRAAIEQGGDPGAFYLGRVDVAVTATTTTATTEMTPAGATVLDAQDFRTTDRMELSSQDHNVGEPIKEFDGRIGSVGVEDTITLSPKLSLVGGIGGDWQTTKAMDYQKGQVIDLLATCRTSGTGCGDTGGVNPQVGLFYAVPTGQLRFTASHKTRMPSLKDRYSYKMGAAVPNPDLKAEHNLTFEGGYQGTLGSKTSFMASVFYSRLDDAIQRRYLQPNLFQLQNIEEASNAGFELDARTRLGPGSTWARTTRT